MNLLELVEKELKTRKISGVSASADTDTPSREAKESMEDKERIVSLEQEVKDLKSEKETWSTEKSALEITSLSDEKKAWIIEKAELETKASQVETLTEELKTQKEELETLRKFKTDTDEAAEKADKIKGIRTKLDAAGIAFDEGPDADYWLSFTEENLDKTIARVKKGTADKKAESSIKVPPVIGEDNSDARAVVADGLKEHKQAKGGS